MLDRNGVMNQSYLEVRCMVLEIAATLDRLDRAPGPASAAGGTAAAAANEVADPRMKLLRQAIDVLAAPCYSTDRAERILRMFSHDDGRPASGAAAPAATR